MSAADQGEPQQQLGLTPDTQAAVDATVRHQDDVATVSIPRGYDAARCRSCNQRIFWANVFHRDGTPKMKDKDPTKQAVMPMQPGSGQGEWQLWGRKGIVSIGPGEPVSTTRRFDTHWAHCPNAKTHRRRRTHVQ